MKVKSWGLGVSLIKNVKASEALRAYIYIANGLSSFYLIRKRESEVFVYA